MPFIMPHFLRRRFLSFLQHGYMISISYINTYIFASNHFYTDNFKVYATMDSYYLEINFTEWRFFKDSDLIVIVM